MFYWSGSLVSNQPLAYNIGCRYLQVTHDGKWDQYQDVYGVSEYARSLALIRELVIARRVPTRRRSNPEYPFFSVLTFTPRNIKIWAVFVSNKTHYGYILGFLILGCHLNTLIYALYVQGKKMSVDMWECFAMNQEGGHYTSS